MSAQLYYACPHCTVFGSLSTTWYALRFALETLQAYFYRISTSLSSGSSATAISFSIARPHPGQQNWRNCG